MIKLNDFSKSLKKNELENKNRIITVQSLQGFRKVCSIYHEFACAEIVSFHEFVLEHDFYPSPQIVFERMENKVNEINQKGRIAIIVGVDIYYSLLIDEQREVVLAKLKRFLDDQRYSISFIAVEQNLQAMDNIFKNPRYENGYQIIKIDEDFIDTKISTTLYLVSSDWFSAIPPDVNSFGEYIKKSMEGNITSQTIKIAIQANDKISGVRREVKQVLNLRDYLREFCEIDDASLSEDALKLIYSKIENVDAMPLKVLKKIFLSEGMEENILQKFYIKSNIAEKEILIFLIKKFVSDGTFLKCLSEHENFKVDTFIKIFVCVPKNILEDEKNAIWAQKRKSILQVFGVQNWIHYLPIFIEQTREMSDKNIVIWLNNETDIEKAELLRRYKSSKERKIEEQYPDIKDYFCNHNLCLEIMDYFKKYKEYKIADKIDSSFIRRKEFLLEIPSTIKSRDSLIQKYRNDEETALLLVDSMGVEYFDMLISLADKKKIKIFSKEIGYANLPSSTYFNKIEWVESRKLEPIKQLDNICHNGVELHTKKTHEKNIVGEFNEIRRIFIDVNSGLERFKRVLLTSDHGSSYLAVCAYNQGLTNNISISPNCDIDDWRYMKNPKNGEICPPELKETLNGEYWVVRNYDRLPKQGGKLFGLHGGATLEEVLVPVIVFERGFVSSTVRLNTNSKVELVEKDDFAKL